MKTPVGAGPAAAARVVYAVVLGLAVGWAALIMFSASARHTLGWDFRAYELAVERLLAGQSMYDETAMAMGPFGLFFYPPPFALLVLPFAVLPPPFDVAAWTVLLAAASVAAIWLLPVSTRTRWAVLLLGALSWPLIFAIQLGQVGPLLLLLFVIGWRWMDRPLRLGIATGLGTVMKLQPALVIGWALVTGKRRAALIAVAVVGLLAAAATVVAGPQSWLDEVSLLGRVSRDVLTPHTFSVGRLALEAGLPEAAATALHWINLALVAGVTVLAVLRASPVASYLVVVVASQYISPILWDHYALVLLLPAAWLMDRWSWWAALIPLSTSVLLIGAFPWLYPASYWAALLAVTWVGIRERRSADAAPVILHEARI